MELEVSQQVALYGFMVALVFGVVAQKTHFCTMGSISDWINMGIKSRFRTWIFAIAIAITGTQILRASGMVDMTEAIYLSTSFGWVGYIVGGLMFGIGMTLGSGCVQRSIVRVGGGNLKSLVVLVVMGITAYATLRGLLAPIRLQLDAYTSLDLSERGMADQSIATIISNLVGGDAQTIQIVLSALIVAGILWYVFSDKEYRKDFDNLLAAVAVGGMIVAGWYITGVLGNDDFEPVAVESVTFVAPAGNAINYVMTYTGASMNFGIAVVLGVIAGSYLYAIISGTFRIEVFASRTDLINHLLAGVLMGFGGVLALGCTIGQGVTGVSTLALGSMIALVSIIAGCAITIKIQYYMLDDSFGTALYETFADFRLLPRRSG
jgi:hypothetical protein